MEKIKNLDNFKNSITEEQFQKFQNASFKKYLVSIEEYDISNYKKGEYVEFPIWIPKNSQNRPKTPNNLNTFLNLINQVKHQSSLEKKCIYETLHNPLDLMAKLPIIISEMIHKIQTGEVVLNLGDEKAIPDLIQEYLDKSIQTIEHKQKDKKTTDISLRTALEIRDEISDRLLPVLTYEDNVQKENQLKVFNDAIGNISNEKIKEIIFKKSIIKNLRESSLEHAQKAKSLKSLKS